MNTHAAQRFLDRIPAFQPNAPKAARLISCYGIGFAAMQTLLMLALNLFVIPFFLFGVLLSLLGGVSIFSLIAFVAVVCAGLLVLLVDVVLTAMVIYYFLLSRRAVYGMILFSIIATLIAAVLLPTLPIGEPPVFQLIRSLLWVAPVYYLPSIIVALLNFRYFPDNSPSVPASP